MIIRKEYLDDLINLKDKNLIKVITGIRRCGKSTLFKLYKEYLKNAGISDEQIIIVNLEEAEFRNINSHEQLYNHVSNKLLKDKMNYVFLDEVQQVTNFQKAVDWLYADKNVDLYITGSNAFLLSGELATLLSGRYVEIKMLPLSFKEYVSYFKTNHNNAELYANYLQNSSFPGTLELNRNKDIKNYLEGIYDSIVLKDIIFRNKISDASLLQKLIEYMFDNIGNMCSVTNIVNTLKTNGRKISIPTLDTYLTALCNSFILYKVGRYDVKGKQYLVTGHKYYIADIGLRYYLLGSRQGDMEHILENIVYLELLRRGYEVYIGKVERKEVDFIALNSENTEYYQVALSVLDEKTLNRELSSLEAIKDHNPKFLLTMDYAPNTSYDGIKQLNIIDWLLQ
ncbi:MAG: ATP-binding protein [Erysipelotrichaceae bacterium]